jgi:hypothetical protein
VKKRSHIKNSSLSFYRNIHPSLSPSFTLLTAAETAVLCQNSPLFKTYGMPPKTMNLIGFLVVLYQASHEPTLKEENPFLFQVGKKVL